MRTIKEYVTKITINRFVMEVLNSSCRDRLGDFITFELVEYPNEKISAMRASEWFKLIMAQAGFVHEHLAERDFGEMGDCWIYPSHDYKTLRIIHKYWSFNTCIFITTILKVICEMIEIPVEEVYKEK